MPTVDTLTVRLTADIDQFRRDMRQGEREIALSAGEMQRAFRGLDQATEATFKHATAGTEGFRIAVDNMATAISTRLEDAILDFRSLGDVLRALERDIVRIALRTTFTKPLEQALAGALGGFDFGSLFGATAAAAVPVTHRGGIVGDPGLPTRAVSPAAFLGAPRLHGGGIVGFQPNLAALGLAANERPIIAQVGETVVPAGRAAGGTVININLPPGADARGFRESAAFVARRAADEIDRRARFR